MIRICVMIAPMYVCLCNGHRDREIREAAKLGFRSAPEIYRHLGKPVRCGRCLDFAARLIDEVHRGEGAPQLADQPI
jgi:bacterioferritin-associated ferredoxin